MMKEVLNNTRATFFFPPPYYQPASRRQNRALTLDGCCCELHHTRVHQGHFGAFHLSTRRIMPRPKTEGRVIERFDRFTGGSDFGKRSRSRRDLLPISHAARNRGRWACGAAARKWTPSSRLGSAFGRNGEEWSS